MNRLAFALLAWILLGLELGLKSALELGATGIAPSFIVPMGMFIAMAATPTRSVWSCLILGLVLDLTSSLPGAAGSPVIVGPWALGMVLAAQLVLAIRPMMIKRNPLTVAFLSVVGAGVAQIVVVAILTGRGIVYGDLAWSAGPELVRRLGSALYTGLAGYVMALGLIPLAPVLGLQLGHQRFQPRR
jgi:hypothetical protein